MTNEKGGTVTYHRADWASALNIWHVWFTEGQRFPVPFTAAEGEAMGLTVPEPAPLVVECNGHRIELSDEDVGVFVKKWGDLSEHLDGWPNSAACIKIAGLLRDARQAPQPTADSPNERAIASPSPMTLARGGA